jgi:DNA-binding MarR family transcriptional regulator
MVRSTMGQSLPQYFETHSEPLDRRIATGLHKLGLAMKHQAWSRASGDGISPTQGQILAAVAAEGPLTGSELAERLGITLPTVSESARALVDKGALERRADPRHPRASLLVLTAHGRTLADKASTWPDFLASAAGALDQDEQRTFLAALVKMIHALQVDGHIPTSRMCVTCTFFRPNVHEGALPHHCAYVDAPMAEQHLRVDCAEHEEADAQRRDALWRSFVG